MVSVSRSGPCIMVLFCQSCPNITVTRPAPPSPPASPSCRPSCGARVSLRHPFNLPSASQQACSYNTGLRWCANPLSSPDPLKAGAIRETTVKSLPAAVTAELIPPGVGVDRSETGRWVDGRAHCCVFAPGHKAVFLLKSRPSLRIMSAPGDTDTSASNCPYVARRGRRWGFEVGMVSGLLQGIRVHCSAQTCN